MIRHTARNRAREDALALRLERAWGWTMHRNPELCPVDYLACDGAGHVRAVVELKPRHHPIAQQHVRALDFHKLATVTQWGAWLDVPALVVMDYTCGAAIGARLDVIERRPLPVRVMGRRDRGDPRDLEPGVILPDDLWEVIP